MAKKPKPSEPTADKPAAKSKSPRAKKTAPAAEAAPFVPRIVVKNFGPLKDVDLELKDFMVFIGPQASGKSTLAKLVWLYHLIPQIAINATIIGGDSERIAANLSNACFNYIYDKMPFASLIKNGGHISFFYPNGNIHIGASEQGSFRVKPDATITEAIISKYQEAVSTIHNILIQPNITEIVLSTFSMRSQYSAILPSERASFGLIGTVQSLDSIFLDSFSQYIKDKQNATLFLKKQYLDSISGGEILMSELFENNSESGYSLRTTNEESVPEKWLSSGQRAYLPLFLMLKNDAQQHRRNSIIIEEIESHLFPTAQNAAIKVTVETFNQDSTPDQGISRYLLTTHSPYILTSLNNLLYAGHLTKKFKDYPEKLAAIAQAVPEKQQLDPARFECYYVDNGGITSIMDHNEGLIEAGRIDQISETIGKTYNQLFDIEMEGNNA